MKQHNDPTVEVAYDKRGKLKYRCLYCGKWYIPNKRWAQKYCEPSCSVKACKERNVGLYGVTGGTLSNSRNATTNTELKNEMVQILELMKYENEKNRLANQNALLDIQIQLKKDMQKIISKQNWNMFLTVLIPIIAPLLSSWAAGLFNKAETAPLDVNSFLKKLDDDFGDRVTPEMKAQIILAMGNIF